MSAIIFLIVLVFYFVPTISALANKHKQVEAIAILNLLLGWTILGWIGAAVWACIRSQK